MRPWSYQRMQSSTGTSTPSRVRSSQRPGWTDSVLMRPKDPSAAASWIGNGVLDNSLEDESLLCEFVGAPVSEGGVESLVVGPPHIVVEVGA